jgi:hypothetical protein
MNSVKVVKVQPYPISSLVTKTEGAPPLRCHIMRLTVVGVLLRVSKEHFFKVGDNHSIEFDVPSTHVTIHASTKVIKTYDNFADASAPAHEKVYLVEMHFRGLDEEERKTIERFIKKIGQK